VQPVAAKAAVGAEPETNPLELWYKRPAEEWLEALAIGNGRMGAMVFGGVASEKLMLNEDSVWAGHPHSYDPPRGAEVLPDIRRMIFEENWVGAQRLADREFMGRPSEQAWYQPVGDLLLEFPGLDSEPATYRRSLDLRSAMTITEFEVDGVHYRREAFVSHPDQVMVVHLTADQPGKISFNATYQSPQRSEVRSHDAQTLALEGISGETEGMEGAVRFVSLVRADADGGTVRCQLRDLAAVDGDQLPQLR
jgi:alpha-L-fucosidase 2